MNTENNISAASDFPFDKEKDIPFSVPIHTELNDNGDIVELHSFVEAGLFASSELKAWHDIIGSEKSDKPFIQKIIDFQLQTPRSMFATAQSVLSGQMSPAEGFVIIRKDINILTKITIT